MKDNFLCVKSISKTFPGVKALSDVSIEIKKGEIHALTGENGAGKSTLIKILTGVYQPDKGGEIYIFDKKIEFKNPIESQKNGIAVIYQDFSLFSNLTVAENISIGLEIQEKKKIYNWEKSYKRAEEVLKKIEIDIPLDALVGELSIAKQQMIAIARSLVYNANLIIMDEPTAALSKEETKILLELIKKLKKNGISVLFVSHKLDELFEVCDTFSVLRDGVFIGSYKKDEIDEQKLISYMVGRKIIYEKKERVVKGKELLKVENLSKKGNFKDISFSLKKGEILGITGIVGAGRTEVFEAIYGITKFDFGEIFLDGEKIKIKTPSDALNYKIAFVPEDRKNLGLILEKSIEDNIVLSSLNKISEILGIINARKKKELCNYWCEKLSVKPFKNLMKTKNLSGGNQQKVVLGKCLSIAPRVLIIDEPTNGIDIGAKTKIHDLLRELADEGVGIIMISSDLAEVLTVSDRILVMRKGRVVGEFNSLEATQEKIINKAILN